MKTTLILSIILFAVMILFPFAGSKILCAALAAFIPNVLSAIIDRHKEDKL